MKVFIARRINNSTVFSTILEADQIHIAIAQFLGMSPGEVWQRMENDFFRPHDLTPSYWTRVEVCPMMEVYGKEYDKKWDEVTTP